MPNSLTISYNGNTIHSTTAAQEFSLKTSGKFLTNDVTIDVDFENLLEYDGSVTPLSS